MTSHVGIFWDYSSCPISDIGDKSNVAISLREECVQHGDVTLFKAYFGLPYNTTCESPSENIRSEIEEAGVVTVDHPKAGFGAFATDIFCFLLDHHDTPASKTVVIVSNNPDIAYLVSALHARRIRVGLIATPGHADKLSSQASWTKNWETFTRATGSSSATTHPKDVPPSTGLLAPSTGSPKSTSDYGLVCGMSSIRDLSSEDASSSPRSSTQIKTEGTEVAEAIPPVPVAPRSLHTRAPAPQSRSTTQPHRVTYLIARKRIPVPLRLPRDYAPFETQVSTSSHKLQLFEDDPLYARLIQDPEALKIKNWQRKLKQLFFYQDIRTNPQVLDELDALFTLLDQYDNMSKDYLAFSDIGKLLTQITQYYLNSFDYRQVYVTRAKGLLMKWEPLVRSSDD